MKNKIIKYTSFIILSLIFITIDKFVLIFKYGFLEIFIFIFSIIILIFSVNQLYKQLKLSKLIKVVLEIITIFIIVWFSILSVDYKRHKNLQKPIFVLSKKLLTTDGIDVNNGLGYDIIQEYDFDLKDNKEYKSKFYLFGIKINEVTSLKNK